MKIRILLFIICAFLLGHISHSQNYREIDSLKKIIPATSDNDTNKVLQISSLAFEYSYIDTDSSLIIAKQALALGRKQNFKRGIAYALNVLGTIYNDKADYKSAIECYTEGRQIAETLNNIPLLTSILGNSSLTHGYLKDYPSALRAMFQCLRIFKEVDGKGHFYPTYLTIGNLYNDCGKIDSALYYYDMALNSPPTKNKTFPLVLHGSRGSCYASLKQYDKAEKDFQIAIKLSEEIRSDYYYFIYKCSLGELYTDMKRFKEAEPLILGSLNHFIKNSMKRDEISSYFSLYKLYDAQKQYQKALINHVKYEELNDSINNAETNKIARELEKKYEDQKKIAQIEKLNSENIAGEAENKRKGQMLTFAAIGCILILIALGFAVYAFINKRKANIELHVLHKEVSYQENELFDKNKNITDSILYAQRIQKALLTSHQYIKESFPDFFILNKPKDIVSGDFYWAQRTGKDFCFMLADCTGHGVPGAFMSLLGISYLNELVIGKGLKDTNVIVDQLRSGIINALSDNNESNYQIKDGMDGVFCKFNFAKNSLEYTAANNTIVVVRNGSVIDLKGDKMPIGRSPKDTEHFTKHEFELQKGDMVYMFTDGFPDQFGGPRGKKLKEKPLKELLVQFSSLPVAQQEKDLSAYLEKWKGSLEQIDDVCLVGFKI